MRILNVLTYFRPHTSGLTIYVERLVEALARRGHQLTVLSSQFEQTLPAAALRSHLKVVRVPVLCRISKGVVMPSFGRFATHLVRSHDVVHLHLPQLDAAGVALRGRLFGKPTVVTYHCDLQLPPGLLNLAANLGVGLMNLVAGRLADRLVTYTEDYAASSPYLRHFAGKLAVIPPPVALPGCSPEEMSAFAAAANPEGRRPVIGMAARLAAEKGVEVLLAALPHVRERYPHVLVLFAGQHLDVLGEQRYRDRLEPALRELERESGWRFLGVLDPRQMAAFYPSLDVLVVPSLNATESFGLVQIEAMMNGVPVVASDLPGVRQPVLSTGMGRLAAVGDAASLATALLDVIGRRRELSGHPQQVAARFAPDACAGAYERLFEQLLDERRQRADRA